MQALFGAFPICHRLYAASVQVLFLNETWWWFASVCYELVFLIILLCIWSITSHCTNSYWEIQLSLHCRKQRQFHFCLYDHSDLDIELFVLSYVIQFLWSILKLWFHTSLSLQQCFDFLIFLIWYQPSFLITLWFFYSFHNIPACAVIIVWFVQTTLISYQFSSSILVWFFL